MSDRTGRDEIARLARELTPRDHERVLPPPEVWEGIERGVADDPSRTATILAFGRRPSRLAQALVAAAVLAVVGVAGVLMLRGDDGRGSVVTEVAMTDDGLEVAAPADGRAALVETDGGFELDLELPVLPEGDGFYEAWLIDTDVDEMYSLGAVDGDGRFVVPAGVDPAAYPIVDISVEPLDGDPTHSGRSVLRGALTL